MSDGAPILQRAVRVTAGGAGLYVRLYAHSDAATDRPTLVFLHEALGSVGQWKSFPATLCAATGCDGLAYDREGHGQSDPMRAPRTTDFYRREAGEVLPELLAALGVRAPVLVGHSDGGTIALYHAALFPGAPRAVVSEAAHVIIEEATVRGIREARRIYESTDLHAKLARYHGDKTAAVFHAWADTWLAPECADWHMLDVLTSIRCPLLLVQGEDDEYGTAAQFDAITGCVAGPVETCMIPDCGHVPHLQAREVVIRRIAEFLRTHTGPV